MAILAKKLKTLPKKPGVYLFKNAQGEVLYVGKAKNLKSRVRNYFMKGRDKEPKTEIMLKQVADLDYIIVSSETESLILENNLIKQYQPRFNVRLRDDKNYQFIKIDYSTEIPQIYPVRRINVVEVFRPPVVRGRLKPSATSSRGKPKSKYFGPYTSATSVKNTLKLIRHIFHLCTNKKVSAKPCFQYHLGRCPGVCLGKVSLPEYRRSLDPVEKFLNHRHSEIIVKLKQAMKEAASQERFEKAASLRDKLTALENIWEKQKIVSTKKENQDYLGVYKTSREAIVNLFAVRSGKLIHQEQFQIQHQDANLAEILERFISQYYQESSSLPKEVFVPEELPNKTLISRLLKKINRIIKPIRGKKAQLLRLASENAKLFYERELKSFEKNLKNTLEGLKNLLKLPEIPHRIEGFDISNIQGFLPVGSMVVFTDGQPDKSQYRKFKIKSRTVSADLSPEALAKGEALAKADDVAMMREMLERRFKHSSAPSPLSPPTGGEGKGGGKRGGGGELWPLPDLIIIDGGKAQLNAALSIIHNSGFKIPIIGLAKRLEEIFLPNKKRPLRLPADSPVLFLLQRIRDGAHRFAITFYRKKHRLTLTRSRLDEAPGIGPKTKKKLLQKFGSVQAIRQASLEALAAEVGLDKAKKIKERL